jgi:hypothetical protein
MPRAQVLPVLRTPWLLLLLAGVVRAMVCLRTAVPSRDGAQYLWLAERAASGDLHGLFATVFPPGYPLLTGALLWLVPALDPFAAGQITSAGCAALAVVPLWWITQQLYGTRAAWWAGLAYALGTWFCRHPAEAMSEGPFYFAVSLWAWLLLRSTPAAAGALASYAYLIRPEGAALHLIAAVWLLAQRDVRALVRFALAALPIACVLPLGYYATGHGFSLTPIAGFTYQEGLGSADEPLHHYFWHLGQIPLTAAEGLGFVTFPLMLLGIAQRRPRSWRAPEVLLLAPLCLQVLVVPMLRSHFRFVGGLGVLWLPFAGVAMALCLERLATHRQVYRTALIALFCLANVGIFDARSQDRIVERHLGRALRASLKPGESIASDMPTMLYYAGLQPPPPRTIELSELLERAAAPQCRFVAFVQGRTAVDLGWLQQHGYASLSLPPELAAMTEERGILVFTH